MFAALNLLAEQPQCWAARGVIYTNQTRNDVAAVNTGQLKHIAKQALPEVDVNLANGTGTAIHALVGSRSTPIVATDYFAVVNLGQLEVVAKPFYERLISADYNGILPWSPLDPRRNDYAMANTGQVKTVSSLCATCAPAADSDTDGLLDRREY